MVLVDAAFFVIFGGYKLAERVVGANRIADAFEDDLAHLFRLVLLGPVAGAFRLQNKNIAFS